MSFLAVEVDACADRVAFLVPNVAIYTGQSISSAAVNEKFFYIRSGAELRYVRNRAQLENKIAKRTLLPGHAIALSALTTASLINRGQTAQLVFQSGNLSIVARGIALESGSAGDTIKVRNADSGRIISGKIMDDGRVLVGS
ncbi:flagellar basal body P-ring formation chaperone FlgA [Bartonella sp. DGB2]|uniref:flagellar basal body P-ring formation chaperone FlgA n=1 Tax=Bartonella sp. DGB2 TaxID=3388426 RepID=UPI00398FF01B